VSNTRDESTQTSAEIDLRRIVGYNLRIQRIRRNFGRTTDL
jgi:hypothetical protein